MPSASRDTEMPGPAADAGDAAKGDADANADVDADVDADANVAAASDAAFAPDAGDGSDRGRSSPSDAVAASRAVAGLRAPDAGAKVRAHALQARLMGVRPGVGGRPDTFVAALAANRAAAPRVAASSPRSRPGEGSAGAPVPSPAPHVPSSGAAWPPPPERHYPAAWALLGGGPSAAPAALPGPTAAPKGPFDPAAAPPARPPPGRPTVRGPVRARPAAAPAPASTSLAQTADAALLVASPGGGQTMQLSIRDDVFAELQCTIELGPAGVVATFYAADPHTRRLLAAEGERLRVRLEARGLTVAAVRVAAAGASPALPAQLLAPR